MYYICKWKVTRKVRNLTETEGVKTMKLRKQHNIKLSTEECFEVIQVLKNHLDNADLISAFHKINVDVDIDVDVHNIKVKSFVPRKRENQNV